MKVEGIQLVEGGWRRSHGLGAKGRPLFLSACLVVLGGSGHVVVVQLYQKAEQG